MPSVRNSSVVTVSENFSTLILSNVRKVLIKLLKIYVPAKKNSIKYKYFSDLCNLVFGSNIYFSFSKLNSYEDYRLDA